MGKPPEQGCSEAEPTTAAGEGPTQADGPAVSEYRPAAGVLGEDQLPGAGRPGQPRQRR